ncbi:MAG: flagellar biosynthesis anti-sigma factor FlgM [Terriglobales bacterium]
MKVDLGTYGIESQENTKPGRPAPTGGSRTAAASRSGSTSTNTVGLDQASFSSDPAQLQSFTAQVLAQPDIRQAKVQVLQQSISDGEYSVSPTQVADAVVSDLSS